jgi:SAM-dependent methyltransferase
MAHPHQLQFVRAVSEHLAADYSGIRVLEIGAFDVNGSIRPCFAGSQYLGVDLIAGPGVDLVQEGDAVDHPDGAYDLTASCECFEHNPKWRETFLNMLRMTRPGGVLLFTCATTGRLEHGTARTSPDASPGTQGAGWDYYRNLKEQDFRVGIAIDELFSEHFFLTNEHACDLYFVGVKKGAPPLFHFDGGALRRRCRELADELHRADESRSRYPKVLRALVRAPMRIAARLPDPQFQNFALKYSRLLYRFSSLTRRNN